MHSTRAFDLVQRHDRSHPQQASNAASSPPCRCHRSRKHLRVVCGPSLDARRLLLCLLRCRQPGDEVASTLSGRAGTERPTHDMGLAASNVRATIVAASLWRQARSESEADIAMASTELSSLDRLWRSVGDTLAPGLRQLCQLQTYPRIPCSRDAASCAPFLGSSFVSLPEQSTLENSLAGPSHRSL